jgi:hypothetical protein
MSSIGGLLDLGELQISEENKEKENYQPDEQKELLKEFNVEVHDGLESKEYKDQKMSKKKKKSSVEVPIDSDCINTKKRKRKKRKAKKKKGKKRKGKKQSEPSVREMEIQLYLDLMQENECFGIEQNSKGEGSDDTFHLKLINFVNQQLEELENELKMNDSKKNEELKYKFNKIRTLAISMKFAENLNSNFYEISEAMYERLSKCDQYFQGLNDKITITNIGIGESKFDEDNSNQDDSEVYKDTEETSQQIMNEVTHEAQFDDKMEKNFTNDSFEEIGKDNQLEFDFKADIDHGLMEIDFVGIKENENKLGECSDEHIERLCSVIYDNCNLDIKEDPNNMEENLKVDFDEYENEIKEYNPNYKQNSNNDNNDIEDIEVNLKDLKQTLDSQLDMVNEEVNLLQQQLSIRKLEINLLKKKQEYSNYHTMDTGLYKGLNDNPLENNKNECQRSSSILMVSFFITLAIYFK